MTTELSITFSELRQTTIRIIHLVSDVTGYERDKIDLRTSINNTIGVDGDDWDDLLMALYEKENLILEGFDFYDYFQDEGQIMLGPLNILTIPIRFFVYVISLGWRHGSFKNYFDFDGELKADLTISDLVTSKIEGRFVKRGERKFKFASVRE